MLAKALALMSDEFLAEQLQEIAGVMKATLAMPRAAEAVEEAARRLEAQEETRCR